MGGSLFQTCKYAEARFDLLAIVKQLRDYAKKVPIQQEQILKFIYKQIDRFVVVVFVEQREINAQCYEINSVICLSRRYPRSKSSRAREFGWDRIRNPKKKKNPKSELADPVQSRTFRRAVSIGGNMHCTIKT